MQLHNSSKKDSFALVWIDLRPHVKNRVNGLHQFEGTGLVKSMALYIQVMKQKTNQLTQSSHAAVKFLLWWYWSQQINQTRSLISTQLRISNWECYKSKSIAKANLQALMLHYWLQYKSVQAWSDTKIKEINKFHLKPIPDDDLLIIRSSYAQRCNKWQLGPTRVKGNSTSIFVKQDSCTISNSSKADFCKKNPETHKKYLWGREKNKILQQHLQILRNNLMIFIE